VNVSIDREVQREKKSLKIGLSFNENKLLRRAIQFVSSGYSVLLDKVCLNLLGSLVVSISCFNSVVFFVLLLLILREFLLLYSKARFLMYVKVGILVIRFGILIILGYHSQLGLLSLELPAIY